MEKVLLIGITGNFGSGKSTVAKIIENEGYPVINSDRLAKDLMEKNQKLRKQIEKTFGKESYQLDGSLNSKWLANIVFASTPEAEQNLMKLNSIVHPFVLDEAKKQINQLIENGNYLIFFESALIYEANIENLFDYIILVHARKEKVIERLTSQGKYTSEEIEHRLSKQIDSEVKRKFADFTIINDGTIEELEKNVKFVLEMIKELQ
ncbi:MAG: dephospho-CoA kinase [Candidatus Kapaibacteriota bacterium]